MLILDFQRKWNKIITAGQQQSPQPESKQGIEIEIGQKYEM